MAVTPLTNAELARFRRKIGDTRMPPAFPDAEIQDLWEEADGNWNKSVLAAYDELIGNSWKFTDYVQNETQEKKNQIFQNLLKARAIWQGKVDADTAAAKNKNQVKMTGLRKVPPRRKELPDAEC